jgi:Leucine-rich repeat (LRR) protein
MFIKKDLRKIPSILEHAVDCHNNNDDETMSTSANATNNDTSHHRDPKRTKVQEPLRELRLSRRSQEFQGTVQVLCQPQYAPKLTALKSLSLYDCQISHLQGLGGMFSASSPELETLNLGRNPISNIPDDFAKMQSLKHVWMDDCRLEGALPKPLMELRNLESLRLPHNRITEVQLLEKTLDAFDTEILPQERLKILCLDRNALVELPEKMKEWVPHLEELMVRHNQLKELGSETLPPSLRILHVSSNQLTNLDALMKKGADGTTTDDAATLETSHCPNLTHLYANANKLISLPKGIVTAHVYWQRLVISHNDTLHELPEELWEKIDSMAGKDGSDDEDAVPEGCAVLWQPNPNLKKPGSEENDGDVADAGSAMEEE